MIVDTSAVVAIVFKEVERELFLSTLMTTSNCNISAASVVELIACYASKGQLDDALNAMRNDLASLEIEIAPGSAEQALVAASARLRYGRGTGRLAKLNYGDSFSYALAKTTGRPMLFKGNDFIHTDRTFAV